MPLDLSIFDKAVDSLQKGKAKTVSSLPGSSLALFLSILSKNQRIQSPSAPFMLLCYAEDTAVECYDDMVFWSGVLGIERPVLIAPAGDPQRLRNLKELYTAGSTGYVASVEAVLTPSWNPDRYPVLRLSRGAESDRDALIGDLKDMGYLAVPLVSGRSELSVRGGILDVFPPESELPVRIEFFGDEIESIRLFDTDSQRTVKKLKEISIGPAKEPEEGPGILDVLERCTLILNEPDDIKRHHEDVFPLLLERDPFKTLSLPLKGEGFDCGIKGAGGLGILREERDSLESFVKRIKELRKKYFILTVCSSEGQAKRIKELYAEEGFDVPILGQTTATSYTGSPVITTGVLSRGFVYDNNIILTEKDIFGKKPGFRAIKKSMVSRLVASIEDFRDGDYLVHADHGIGKFLGLKKQVIEDYEGDFIVIEYLGGDRLYVPLERINTIQKYHAPESARPRIDRLGGKVWQKTRKRIKQKIKDMAKRLLSLYARRSTAAGHVFSKDTELHKEFDGFFLYEETPDQLTAISEIKHDMEDTTPMERLLCGDVGYGKTEVIMRACFKAVYDSKQVAVLVPTTILAEQHYNTFTSRFSAFPIRIDFLSRFKGKAEQKQTLKALSNGDIDIIIGTHRLLARDVSFYNLGLLVIDEEHKFGVSHKEKIKGLKGNVAVLTLSATPIPRTLHMAISGIRSMSVIETPPEDRLAVRSFVARFQPGIIQEALRKELDRDGQAFFVHNRVQDIYSIADYLKRLVPEGKIAVAHGQMKERELERVMRSFLIKETNILVSTAIIGAGLDIPAANTIIINRADKFGLADLYQLRGRVGRSNIRAYAYFLIPGEEIITVQARKKLQAIQELSYLGAGFRLAMRDLEIRGAGNLLGAEQSGHIEAVGFDLYVEMLEQAVAELKGEKVIPSIEPVLDLKITALIPEQYIENPDLRLSLYRKIASAKDSKSLQDIREELRDRFGIPPDETLRLLEIMHLKTMAKRLAITGIHNKTGIIRMVFAPETPVTPSQILSIYEKRKQHLKLLPEGGVEINLRNRPWRVVCSELTGIMGELIPQQL
jgi:transcription-repair coupling factor (superfamily II helicase)